MASDPGTTSGDRAVGDSAAGDSAAGPDGPLGGGGRLIPGVMFFPSSRGYLNHGRWLADGRSTGHSLTQRWLVGRA